MYSYQARTEIALQGSQLAMNVSLSIEQVRRDVYNPVAGPRDSLPKLVDVAIIGGGPVGLTMANLLGSYGVDTLLLERSRLTTESPKAIVLDDEYMRLLDALGLAGTMLDHVVGPVGIDFLSPLGFKLTGSEGAVTTNGFAARSCMAQPMFEKVLLGGISSRGGVKLCFGAELLSLMQTDDAIDLVVRKEGENEVSIRAKFVIGCDGAHSFVRRTLGLQFPGSNLRSPRMVIDLAQFPDQSLNCRYWCNPSRPINSIPAPYGGRRIEIMLNKGETAEEITRPETVKRIIARYTPYAADDLKIARAVVYDFSERVADRLSKGRAFLMGDAAHIMPPSGGQGLNSGGRDAANLAWKLAAVLRLQTRSSVLDSYHVERWNHVKAVVAYAVRLGAFANVRSWPRSLLRDAGFAIGRLVPAVKRRLMDSDAPRPYYKTGLFIHRGEGSIKRIGRLMPRLTITSSAGSQSTLDQSTGLDFALIGIDVPSSDLERVAKHATWTALGARAIGIWTTDLPAQEAPSSVPSYLVHDAGQSETIRSERGRILVVRPDRYVAAIATAEAFDDLSSEYGRLLGIAVAASTVRDLSAA